MVVDNTKCRHCSFAPLVFTLFEPHSYIKVTLAANFVLCACGGKVVDIAIVNHSCWPEFGAVYTAHQCQCVYYLY